MRPILHPSLVNGRSGDPALYVETLFEGRAILFDLGDISSLSPGMIQRLEYVFVSHAHIDHFIGFDRLLRPLVMLLTVPLHHSQTSTRAALKQFDVAGHKIVD